MFSKFFKTHPEFVLASLAVLFVATAVVFSFWSIGTLFKNLNRATVVGGDSSAAKATFDIEGARSLNLEGAPR